MPNGNLVSPMCPGLVRRGTWWSHWPGIARRASPLYGSKKPRGADLDRRRSPSVRVVAPPDCYSHGARVERVHQFLGYQCPARSLVAQRVAGSGREPFQRQSDFQARLPGEVDTIGRCRELLERLESEELVMVNLGPEIPLREQTDKNQWPPVTVSSAVRLLPRKAHSTVGRSGNGPYVSLMWICSGGMGCDDPRHPPPTR
jgi:hypothetical protein